MWMKISARSAAAFMIMMSTLRHGLAVTMMIVGDGSTIGVLVSAESRVLGSSSSANIAEDFLSPYTTVLILSRVLLIFRLGFKSVLKSAFKSFTSDILNYISLLLIHLYIIENRYKY